MTLDQFVNLDPEYQHMLGVEEEVFNAYQFLIQEERVLTPLRFTYDDEQILF
jgi:hypothetical protein